MLSQGPFVLSQGPFVHLKLIRLVPRIQKRGIDFKQKAKNNDIPASQNTESSLSFGVSSRIKEVTCTQTDRSRGHKDPPGRYKGLACSATKMSFGASINFRSDPLGPDEGEVELQKHA